jgi:predicted transposase/invertase (TIGR01784 family)
MDHPIDPKTDCVFKALLGAEDNRNLLIHFLNATLGRDLPSPVTQVDILNPYNEREFVTDKLSIVDVKARDDHARLYQAEIQLVNHRDLPARILYTWADLYSQQLQSGQDYDALQPTYSIWLLGEDLLRGDPCYAHRYRLRDERDRCLLDHSGIYLFELNKFATEHVETEEQRWLKFFKDGEHLNADHLPDWMQTPEMRQAMTILKAFSDKERAYHVYQARQDFLRQQRSIQRELDDERAARAAERQAKEAALQARETERQAKEAALQGQQDALQAQQDALQAQQDALQAQETERQAKEAALAEIERLKALLHDRDHPAGT